LLIPRWQAKHSTHSSRLTVARFRAGSMAMAPIGQTGTQLAQATHLDWSICISNPSGTRRSMRRRHLRSSREHERGRDPIPLGIRGVKRHARASSA